MNGFLDIRICNQAIGMVMPSIRSLMEDGTFKRKQMCIVVGNPLIPPGTMSKTEWLRSGILFEHDIGEKAKWDYGFDVFAKHKAYLSWRHRLSTYEILTRHPHLLEQGDVLYYGSVWLDGLVVAASGVEPYYDEWTSATVAAAIRALCIKTKEGIDPNGPYGAFLK